MPGVHLPLTLAQGAPCHGLAAQAPDASTPVAHDEHAQTRSQGYGVATGSSLALDGVSSTASAPTDAGHGEGHACCLMLVGALDRPWAPGVAPLPQRPVKIWVSTHPPADLRPPNAGL